MKDPLKVDVTFDVSFDGQPSAAFLGIRSTEYVLLKAREFPVLKPICIILKKLLNTRELNKPFAGGMSSFTLFLMASAFLRSSPPFKCISECLLSFLQYYGSVFDYRNTYIMADCIVMLDGQLSTIGNLGLTVSSPLQPEFNVAYNVTRYEEIKACFWETYEKLMKAKEIGTTSGILGKILN